MFFFFFFFFLKKKDVIFFFFFFQAEDGIRDLYVTGVQTCALPICAASRTSSDSSGSGRKRPRKSGRSRWSRSEERRVGKECRCRWSPYHQKKKRKNTSSHRPSTGAEAALEFGLTTTAERGVRWGVVELPFCLSDVFAAFS